MSGDDHNNTTETIHAVARAMEGVEVWIGFRDEAGDDDFASGTIDTDGLRNLARAILSDRRAMAAIRGEVAS